MSETKPVERRRPPTVGEHTDSVLKDLGYGAAQIASMRERGVV
jgi:crotonobetainyl-CoA:carnitine CoA-transferase CaiB-like acyl-CoA transferase